MFEYFEFPAALKASTRYRYVVCAVSPGLANVVMLASTRIISAKFVHPAPAHRSIANPVSLSELSVQLRLIWLNDVAVAIRVEGALGLAPPPAFGFAAAPTP